MRNQSVHRKHLHQGLAQSRTSVTCELPPPPSMGCRGLMTGVRGGDKSLLLQAPGPDIHVGGRAVPWDWGNRNRKLVGEERSTLTFFFSQGGRNNALSPRGLGHVQAERPEIPARGLCCGCWGLLSVVSESHCWGVVYVDSQVCN